MINQPDSNEKFEIDNLKELHKSFSKYMFFWRYFVLSVALFLFSAFIYTRYSNPIYKSSAKIKILDEKENSLKLPTAGDLFKNTQINLENELEILKSYPILEKVVRNLNLTTSVTAVGDVMKSLTTDYPFVIVLDTQNYIIKPSSYRLELKENGLEIVNLDKNDKKFFFKDFTTSNTKNDLPFEIEKINKKKWIDNAYEISFSPINNVIENLKSNIEISPVGKESEVISLVHKSMNTKYSKDLLNELINVFNNDGIADRRLVHKRTIDFVNKRFSFLSYELDSIEVEKQSFKIDNDLVDLSINSNYSLEKSSKSQDVIFDIENQLSVTELLINTLDNKELELLPANLGIDNNEINKLISAYNEKILQSKKLVLSAGINNPAIKQINYLIDESRVNIQFSLQNHLLQLNNLLSKLSRRSSIIENKVADIPEQEKILRSIERNQQIKESLYLFLLQKREESQVSFAVTEPSIKVVEYAVSESKPIFPNKLSIYSISLLIGLLIPFLFVFLIFLFDTKIHNREDLEKLGLPLVGEIPLFSKEEEILFLDPTDRTIVAESYRMLSSNFKYFLDSTKKSNVIICTSSIKGEGKTINAINISLAYASLGKKVLLIGSDLRNPQIHNSIGENKNIDGLVNYLVDNTKNWKEFLIKRFHNHPNHDILLSGAIPPNPLNLINNGNLQNLIEEARLIYDYIIIDSAPTLLVADTLNMLSISDAVLYVVKSNHTEKSMLKYIEKFMNDNKNSNIGVVLNGVGTKNSYGYSYGYGYGYSYKYSYNYGYGYGYSEDKL